MYGKQTTSKWNWYSNSTRFGKAIVILALLNANTKINQHKFIVVHADMGLLSVAKFVGTLHII